MSVFGDEMMITLNYFLLNVLFSTHFVEFVELLRRYSGDCLLLTLLIFAFFFNVIVDEFVLELELELELEAFEGCFGFTTAADFGFDSEEEDFFSAFLTL